MTQQYNLEVFGRDLAFIGNAAIPSPEISFDYLTLEKTTIAALTVPGTEKGCFVSVSHVYDGKTIYQGIVDDVQQSVGTMQLSIKPLLSLLDVDYYTTAPMQTVEGWLSAAIKATYLTTDDTAQALPVSVSVLSTTTATMTLPPVCKIFDVATAALTQYGVVVTVQFRPAQADIVFTLSKPGQALKLEADLKNCISPQITVGDAYGGANKDTFVNEVTGEKVTWYLHPDGSIDNNNTDRITPVCWKIQTVADGETWQTDTEDMARQDMAAQQYNNLAELTYSTDDQMVQPLSIAVGTVVQISYKGTWYRSILTGYAISGTKIKLIFGAVRIELTKKLILERRKKHGY